MSARNGEGDEVEREEQTHRAEVMNVIWVLLNLWRASRVRRKKEDGRVREEREPTHPGLRPFLATRL